MNLITCDYGTLCQAADELLVQFW